MSTTSEAVPSDPTVTPASAPTLSPEIATAGPTRYTDARAHELRAAYLARFGGDEIPVPVESIAEDLLGLRIEACDLGTCSGMLLPVERLIRVNAAAVAARFDVSALATQWRFDSVGLAARPA